MKKQKLKFTRAELETLLDTIKCFSNYELEPGTHAYLCGVILNHVRLKILTKLLSEKKKYSLTLKDFEAHAAQKMYHLMDWSDLTGIRLPVMYQLQNTELV